MERRLAVIMSADLVGFTSLMEKDEVGTWAQLRALRKELIDPVLAERNGTIFKTTGDGILVEFQNCVDAVEAAVGIQSSIFRRYRLGSEKERLTFRVGIHMGDVIADDGDLIGDAVNVSTRLESICEPGGVCISGAVHDAIKRNGDIPFEDIGTVELQKRSEPVHGFVWRYGVVAAPDMQWKTIRGVRPSAGLTKRMTTEPARTLSVPTVAILPLKNFSDDEELGFFGTGIAEDITTELYRFKSFSVISRTSSFMYADEAKSVQEIGRELGASYVLEGSVRKLGPRIRVNAQLIDVASNDHVWAERFDVELPEIFAVQDQIVAKIVGTLGDGIERHRLQKSKHLAPSELEAYELMLRGLEMHKQGYVSYEQAVRIYELFSEAVKKDPNLARARAWKVCAASRLWPVNADPEAFDALVDDALVELGEALKLNDSEPEAHRIYGAISILRRDFERAKFHVEKALAANPNHSHVLAKSANFYSHYGEPERALELLEKAITINPHHPDWYWQEFGLARWVMEDYQAAIEDLGKSTALSDYDHAYLAASHWALGNAAEAGRHVARFKEINPDITADIYADRQPFRHEEVRARLCGQLKAAGIP